MARSGAFGERLSENEFSPASAELSLQHACFFGSVVIMM
jgi:hypothetical protein